jgi:hypothetical protein
MRGASEKSAVRVFDWMMRLRVVAMAFALWRCACALCGATSLVEMRLRVVLMCLCVVAMRLLIVAVRLRN